MSLKRLILIRHARTTANDDHTIYGKLPDALIPLSDEGREQAEEVGQAFKAHLEKEGWLQKGLRFYISPYQRTKETTNGILKAWGMSHPFDVIEHEGLREISGGYIEGLSYDDRRTQYPLELSHYDKHMQPEHQNFTKFFARYPGAESHADVTQRVRVALRDISDDCAITDDAIETAVIVSHAYAIEGMRLALSRKPPQAFSMIDCLGNTSALLIEREEGRRWQEKGLIYGAFGAESMTKNPILSKYQPYVPKTE